MLNNNTFYPYYSILDLHNHNDLAHFHYLIYRHFPKEKDPPPLYRYPHKRIIDLLESDTVGGEHTRWCVIESNYVDRNTSIAYSKLFGRAFTHRPPRPTRYHFFSSGLDRLDWDSLLDAETLQSNYQGFFILGDDGTIGRCVIPPRQDSTYWTLIPAQSQHSVNLGGIHLKAAGAPFIQQDGHVAACASAAMWMASTVALRSFSRDILPQSPCEITGLATRYSMPDHGLASAGLNAKQMLWALHEMGFEPLMHDTIYGAEDSLDIIQEAIESGSPPILLVHLPRPGGFHAVAAFGHVYDPNAKIRKHGLGDPIRIREWYPYFLINDDQIGPYIRMTLMDPPSGGYPLIVLNPQDEMQLASWYGDAYVYGIICCLPPRYTMRPRFAQVKAQNTLVMIESKWRGSYYWPKNPVYRTFLLPSNQWKASMIPESRGGRKGLSDELARYYRGLSLSRYIWVTEILSVPDGQNSAPFPGQVLAEVIVDPTSHEDSIDFLAIHVPGMFFRMTPDNSCVSDAIDHPILLHHDPPYAPYVIEPLCQPPRGFDW